MAKKSPKQKQVLPMEVIGALADAFDKSPQTITRWIDTKDDRLTSQKAKDVFVRKSINHEFLTEEVTSEVSK